MMVDPATLERAVELVWKGEVVGVETDTVWGLVGKIERSVYDAIIKLKGRPTGKPIAVLFGRKDWVLASPGFIIDPISRFLMDNFWPGALTLVLPIVSRQEVFDNPQLIWMKNYLDIYPDLQKVGVRVPEDSGNGTVIHQLLCRMAVPLLATSANLSDQPPMKSGEEITREWELPLILENAEYPSKEPSANIPNSSGSSSVVVEVIWDEHSPKEAKIKFHRKNKGYQIWEALENEARQKGIEIKEI